MDTKKNPGGRPPKFKTAIELEIAIDTYFLECDEKCFVRGKTVDSTPYTVEGLCLALDISRETLLCYEKGDAGFSDTIKKAKMRIQQDVMERGLSGRSNPAVSIFNLKNNFGYVDKQEHEVNNRINIEQITGMKVIK
ncbi:DNA-packaging protein [Parabacteroides sp. PF5-9]|uniref:DNA-packaging protein n=1 Tax=Parabacteroides sp. PF5-9 TaxID=1742404 RepID=UPI00247716BD|nr:DNA-packaging protein [Parabacteroides sp. PF5-9]MDH6357619.1 hypothetical protein [Parabacteroides sp. PF5-9]